MSWRENLDRRRWLLANSSLAVETEEERRARLENNTATKRLAQVGHGNGRRKKSKTGINGSYRTALVNLD